MQFLDSMGCAPYRYLVIQLTDVASFRWSLARNLGDVPWHTHDNAVGCASYRCCSGGGSWNLTRSDTMPLYEDRLECITAVCMRRVS